MSWNSELTYSIETVNFKWVHYFFFNFPIFKNELNHDGN